MKRIVAIDSLRGIAVLMVIGIHYEIPGFRSGFFGVDIFFVISGYLITSLIINEFNQNHIINLPRFYLRRVLRLYPALLLLIIFLSPFLSIQTIFSALFYFYNWARALQLFPVSSEFVGHLWSLSVEEQFYLIWPPILYFLLRSRIKKVELFFVPLIFAVFSFLVRIVLLYLGNSVDRIVMGIDTHSDGLFIGCALALLLAFEVAIPKRIEKFLVSFPIMALILAVRIEINYNLSFVAVGYFIIALAVAVLIFWIAKQPSMLVIRFLTNRPLAWVGKVSYGLYLWHWPIWTLFHRFAPTNPYLGWISLVITFAVTFLSFQYYESPILRLKDRLAVKHVSESIKKF